MKVFPPTLTLTLTLLTAAGLSGCGPKHGAPPVEPAQVVRGVTTETLELRSVPEEYEAAGTVRARSSTTLSARTVGTVTSIPVREGDRVRAGQLVAEIDSRDLQTQADKADAASREAREALVEVEAALRAAEHGVQAAHANRDLASTTLSRFKTLAERGAVSRQEYDEADARSKAASAELARAAEMRETLAAKRRQVLARIDQAAADGAGIRIAQSYARVTAPVSGVIVAKQAEVGTLAAPGVPLLTLEDDSRYRLEAVVEESLGSRIRVGSPARVRLDALGGREVSGKVEEVSATADPATRSYLVKIGVEGAAGLRSGLFGRARFRTGERKALLIPKSALLARGQLAGVIVVGREGRAGLRLVTTGREEGSRVEVLSGLSVGERIVAERPESVPDGSRVE